MSTAQPTQKPSNYSDVLTSIDEFYTENTVDVFCPCANSKLKYKPLSVKQLKEFIELQVSVEKDDFGVLPGLNILTHINKILADNCVNPADDLLSQLSVVDRDAVILQLRANAKTHHEVANEDGEKESVDLSELVDNIKEAKFDKNRIVGDFGENLVEKADL